MACGARSSPTTSGPRTSPSTPNRTSSAILDSVERDREIMSHNGVNKLLARIPIEIYERSVHEQWSEDDWARWLNSRRGRAVPHLARARLDGGLGRQHLLQPARPAAEAPSRSVDSNAPPPDRASRIRARSMPQRHRAQAVDRPKDERHATGVDDQLSTCLGDVARRQRPPMLGPRRRTSRVMGPASRSAAARSAGASRLRTRCRWARRAAAQDAPRRSPPARPAADAGEPPSRQSPGPRTQQWAGRPGRRPRPWRAPPGAPDLYDFNDSDAAQGPRRAAVRSAPLRPAAAACRSACRT